MSVKQGKSKIRVIDEGTVYDVPGRLRKLCGELEGKRVRTCVVITETKDEGGVRRVRTHWFGKGSSADAVMMLELGKKWFTS